MQTLYNLTIIFMPILWCLSLSCISGQKLGNAIPWELQKQICFATPAETFFISFCNHLQVTFLRKICFKLDFNEWGLLVDIIFVLFDIRLALIYAALLGTTNQILLQFLINTICQKVTLYIPDAKWNS